MADGTQAEGNENPSTPLTRTDQQRKCFARSINKPRLSDTWIWNWFASLVPAPPGTNILCRGVLGIIVCGSFIIFLSLLCVSNPVILVQDFNPAPQKFGDVDVDFNCPCHTAVQYASILHEIPFDFFKFCYPLNNSLGDLQYYLRQGCFNGLESLNKTIQSSYYPQMNVPQNGSYITNILMKEFKLNLNQYQISLSVSNAYQLEQELNLVTAGIITPTQAKLLLNLTNNKIVANSPTISKFVDIVYSLLEDPLVDFLTVDEGAFFKACNPDSCTRIMPLNTFRSILFNISQAVTFSGLLVIGFSTFLIVVKLISSQGRALLGFFQNT